MEYSAKCLVCGWSEAWTVEAAAQAAATWHVHDAHPETWLLLVGSDPRAERAAP